METDINSDVIINLIDKAIPGAESPTDDADAQMALGAQLSDMASDRVDVLGVGEWHGQRAPLTIMASTPEARDVAVAIVTGLYPSLAMIGERDLPEDDVEPEDYPIGYFMAWLGAAPVSAIVPAAAQVAA